MSTDFIVVYVTVPSQEVAEGLAAALLEARLAACVNVLGPLQSHYRWQEQIQHDQELLLMVKSRRALFELLKELVLELHPYETPEVIALPILAGAAGYLAWLEDSLSNGI